jgi:hypothetical protein
MAKKSGTRSTVAILMGRDPIWRNSKAFDLYVTTQRLNADSGIAPIRTAC